MTAEHGRREASRLHLLPTLWFRNTWSRRGEKAPGELRAAGAVCAWDGLAIGVEDTALVRSGGPARNVPIAATCASDAIAVTSTRQLGACGGIRREQKPGVASAQAARCTSQPA